MRKILLLLVLVFGILSFSHGVLEFPNADVYYPKGYEEIGIYIGRMFESTRQDTIDYVGYDPGKINIVLVDYGTSTNGVALSHQHNTIRLFVWPPDGYVGTRLNASSWYRQVLVHEFTHIVHTKYSTGLAAVFAFLFGGVPTTQMLSPFVEAVAIFAESQMHHSEGRLNNPIWGPGLFASNYLSGTFPSLSHNMAPFSYSPRDYRGGALYYNYMAGFYDYLVDAYGLDSVKEYHRVVSRALPVVGLITAPRRAFGKSLPALYSEWKTHVAETSVKYMEFEEAYTISNGLLYDIHLYDEGIIFSGARIGPVSSWGGFAAPITAGLLPDGSISPIGNYASSVVRQEDKTTYVMRDSASKTNITTPFATIWTRKIWKIEPGMRERVVASGPITAFDVHNGELYVAFYDTVTMTSMIVTRGRVLAELDWQVKDLVISDDGKIALYLAKEGFYGVIGLLEEGKVRHILEDPYFKGSGITWWENRIVYTAAYEPHTNDAYALDIRSGDVLRLTEGAILAKAVVIDDTIYGVGHSTTQKGMSILKIPADPGDYSIPEAPLDKIPQEDVEYAEANYLEKAAAYFARPSIIIPFFAYEEPNTTLGLVTLHYSVFDNHYMELNPSFTFGINRPGLELLYRYSPIPSLNIGIRAGFTPIEGFGGSFDVSTLLYETALGPHRSMQVLADASVDTGLDLNLSAALRVMDSRWNFVIRPILQWDIDELELLPTPSLRASASFSPTLSTFVRANAFVGEQTLLSAGVAQDLFEINRGIYPFIFLGEVAVGAAVYLRDFSFDTADIYVTMGISETLTRLLTLYPKIGVTFDEDFTPGFLFRLDTQM